MDQNKLNELKELARKATPGPWDICAATAAKNSFKSILIHGNEQIAIVKTPRGLGRRGSTKDIRERDAAYIAAANPSVVLALIEKIEILEKEADWLAEQVSLLCDTVEHCAECSVSSDCQGKGCKEVWRDSACKAVEENSK